MHRPLSRLGTAVALASIVVIGACGGPSSTTSPTSPTSTAPPSIPPPRIDPATVTPSTSYTIGFSSLRDTRAAFTTHTESGFTLSAVSGDWISIATYGNPQPFIEFYGPAGVTTTGEIRITAGGAPFWLGSIDFYSSTTKIPYVLEGSLNSEPMFTVVDVIGSTFGAFARRPNPKADVPIQELRIRLSNPSATCCTNPMGVDNIVLSR